MDNLEEFFFLFKILFSKIQFQNYLYELEAQKGYKYILLVY